MELRDRVFRPGTVVLLGVVLLAIPAFDMWQDVAVGGKPPLSTALENSVLVALALSVSAAGLWLARTGWADRHARTAARVSVLGTVGVAAVYAWLLSIQFYLQGELKPLIIAADGVVVGALAAFYVGVYSARGDMESEAVAAERDRFSALFEDTTDRVLAVETRDGEVVVEAVNAAFEDTFGADAVDPGDAVGDTGLMVEEEYLARVRAGEGFSAEVRRPTVDGVRDFLARFVPLDDGDGFVVLTDLTDQKRRERQLETLNGASRELLTADSVESVGAVARAGAADLFPEATVGVWVLDDGRARLVDSDLGVTDGGTAATAPDAALLRRALDADGVVASGGGASDGAVPAGDGAGDAGGGRRFLVAPLADRHFLAILREGGGFSDSERVLAEVLSDTARAAAGRIDREESLRRRNDQLELLNSLLRHDIQNAMTVVRSRAVHLAEELDGREADFADTIVAQSDDVADTVDRLRPLLDALTGGSEADLEPVDLSRAVADRVERLRTTYDDVEVSVDVPDGLGVTADDTLPNVLGNLLTNAVEHNDEPVAEVSVRATRGDGRVVLEVADDGPGIPDGTKDAVFRRGEGGVGDAEIGSGFGLFFVDAMVRRWGGEVSVRDNEPKGSVFRLELEPAG